MYHAMRKNGGAMGFVLTAKLLQEPTGLLALDPQNLEAFAKCAAHCLHPVSIKLLNGGHHIGLAEHCCF